MRKSFTIGQSNELVHDDNIYDLHNRFDLEHLSISPSRSLTLVLCPHVEYGRGLPSLRVEAVDVDFLELSNGFGTRDLSGIEELGYKSPDDTDLDWLMGEHQAKSEDHLVLRFSAEDYIRFHARDVSLVKGERVDLTGVDDPKADEKVSR